MYEKLGRMMGRSYEESVQILVKTIKNSESQTRIEIINTFEKVPIFFFENATGFSSSLKFYRFAQVWVVQFQMFTRKSTNA
jgi:hypothetical protein